MKKTIFLSICLSFVLAEVNISGDGRIRPRLDIKSNGNENLDKTDLYYLYGGRLNIDADIGNGWFFKSTLGINNGSASVKMGVDETFTEETEVDSYIIYEDNDGYTDTVPGGNINSARPIVSFLNLYYGIKKEKFGLWGGAIPIKHNPSLDIHFYPTLMVDLPWATLNNNSTTGFAGYINKLNWFISINENNVEFDKYITEADGDTIDAKHIDSFTIGFDFTVKWSEYISIHPRTLFSVNDPPKNFPITFGLDMNFKDIFKIYSSLSYYYTMQTIDQDDKYNGSHVRFKLNRKFGSGKFTFWTDFVKYRNTDTEYDLTGSPDEFIIDPDTGEQTSNGEYNANYGAESVLDVETNFMFIWIDYDYNLFNSDLGSVSIKPTIRYQIGKLDDPDYNRIKLELTMGIKFK